MTKRVLPPCSISGCERQAGAIINDDLLCAEHAVIAFDEVIRLRNAPDQSGTIKKLKDA